MAQRHSRTDAPAPRAQRRLALWQALGQKRPADRLAQAQRLGAPLYSGQAVEMPGSSVVVAGLALLPPRSGFSHSLGHSGHHPAGPATLPSPRTGLALRKTMAG